MSKSRKASTVSDQPQDPQVDESLLPNDDEPDLTEFENQTVEPSTPQEAVEATANLEDGEGAKAENAEASTSTEKPKTKKDPVPDGFEPPVAFTKRMNDEFKDQLGGVEMKPQVMYGYLKQNDSFPKLQNTDGHWLVDIEKGREWFAALLTRRAERAAKKAAAPAETQNGEVAQDAEATAEPSNAS
jgi:hypothetical protein